MNTYQVTVVKPKAFQLLKDMEDENLIEMRPTGSMQRFRTLIEELRSIPDPPSFEEITKEVEQVRRERFERRNGK